eukprot:5099422-Heterocapsa_arctica.AAC.1
MVHPPGARYRADAGHRSRSARPQPQRSGVQATKLPARQRTQEISRHQHSEPTNCATPGWHLQW